MKISPIWQRNQTMMHWLIDNGMSEEEKLRTIQRTELFAVNSTDPVEQRLSADAYWNLFSGNADFCELYRLGESKFYDPAMTFEYQGVVTSLDFFKKVYLASLCGRCDTVLEVGSGFGQIARIMLLAGRCNRYVIIDLPESLYFARLFLQLSVPQFMDRITFVSTDELSKFTFPEGVDCFVNSSSLGEMNNEASKHYIQMVQNANVNRIVLLNRLLNTYDPSREYFRENENAWYFNLDSRWKIERWELEPAFTRIPYEQYMHHRELLFVAERIVEEVKAPSLNVFQQRWYSRFSNRGADRRANILFPDHGTLHQLLENVRISPSGVGIDALLKYLKCLGMRYPFEEEKYLMRKFKQLTGRQHEYYSDSIMDRMTTKLAVLKSRFS